MICDSFGSLTFWWFNNKRRVRHSLSQFVHWNKPSTGRCVRRMWYFSLFEVKKHFEHAAHLKIPKENHKQSGLKGETFIALTWKRQYFRGISNGRAHRTVCQAVNCSNSSMPSVHVKRDNVRGTFQVNQMALCKCNTASLWIVTFDQSPFRVSQLFWLQIAIVRSVFSLFSVSAPLELRIVDLSRINAIIFENKRINYIVDRSHRPLRPCPIQWTAKAVARYHQLFRSIRFLQPLHLLALPFVLQNQILC